MPTLHLIDRPGTFDSAITRRQGVGALASGASHLGAIALFLLVLQFAPAQDTARQTIGLDTQRLVWFPNSDTGGGGRQGGGNQSVQPARRAQVTGDQPTTIPASTPQPSTDAITEPPIEPLTIAAQPMASGSQMLAGPVTSDSTGDALGPNIGPTGDGDGRTRGQGNGPADGIGDSVRSVGPGVTTPIVIQQVKPQYTAEAMRAKVQGSVWLDCVVMSDGSVGNVRVKRSLDALFGLDQEAITAARQWRFKPGIANGKPVAVAITIELTFTLR